MIRQVAAPPIQVDEDVALEVVYCSVPYIFIGSLLFFALIYVAKVPAPSASIVEEILGKDPYYEEVSGEDQDDKTHRYSMKVVAHRGAGLDAPENSISAFKLAKERGCTAVEFDLALSADNMPIIFHDTSVERVTLKTGNIQEMMWADIKKLDISAKHPFKERYKGERIPLFEEVIIECLEMDFRLFIDIKSDLQFSSFRLKGNKVVETILDAYNRYPGLYKRAIVSSFNPLVIYLIRRANPGIVCSLAYRPHFFSYESYNGTVGASRPRYKNLFKHLAAQWLDIVHGWLLEHFHYYLIGLSAILLQKDIVNMHVVSHWRDRGLRVIPWTVNLPLEKQFFSRVLKLTYMTDTLLAVSDDLKPRVSRQSTREIHESTTNEPNQLFKLQPKKESTINEPHELDS
uniref:GP-PDE domain-containing protein n=1 Tax=Timema cristinae TaxID=61476 RepID=A0A7R9CRT5_TIMCR|nr:unnamed protein product [Timema cristinae]